MRLLLVRLLYICCTPIVWVIMMVQGINFRMNSLFCGLPFLSKQRGSKYSIGSNCKFLSTSWSNLIGINHRCIISTSSPNAVLEIGNNCGFSGVTIWCFKSIKIGDNVKVGANSIIMDGDAHQDDDRAGDNKEVVIGNNVWIGANVTVLKGVHIGDNSVIGMGSIVTKDIPSNSVAVGNPCRVVKQLQK